MKSIRVYSAVNLGLIAFFLLFLALPSLPLLTLLNDSEQYTEMSRALFSSDFYRAFDGKAIPLALSLRPPLYPLLVVSIADNLPGVSLESGIVSVHLALALAVLVIAPFSLRNFLAPSITIIACGSALYSIKQMIYCHMSEFLSALFLLGALFSLIAWYAAPTGRRSTAVSLLLSCSVLTRLALLPWLIIITLLPLLTPRGKRVSVCLGLLVGCLPLLLWNAFNLHRLGSFSFGSHGNYMYFAAARTLGDIPHSSNDSAELSAVIDRFNQEGSAVSEEGWRANQVHRWAGEYYDSYHRNFDLAWGPLLLETQGHPALSIFLRTARAHSNRYLAFLKGGLYTFLNDYALLLLGCLITQCIILIRAPHHRGFALANITFCIGSVIYLTSVLSAFLWVHRYFTSLQPALVFSTIAGLAVVLGKRGFFRIS